MKHGFWRQQRKVSEFRKGLERAGLKGFELEREAERQAGRPVWPEPAYYYRHFRSLFDALREILAERPESASAKPSFKDRGREVLRPLVKRLRGSPGELEPVKDFLEANAVSLSQGLSGLTKGLGVTVKPLDLVRWPWWPSTCENDLWTPVSPKENDLVARAHLGYLVGSLYLAYSRPKVFFRRFAKKIDSDSFDSERLGDVSTAKEAVVDALFRWGTAALLHPEVRAAWNKLAAARDPASFQETLEAASRRKPYKEGAPPQEPGGPIPSIHARRVKSVRAVERWIDIDTRKTAAERARLTKILQDAGLWNEVRHRLDEKTCRAPLREALKIVAKAEGVTPDAIRRSLGLAKRKSPPTSSTP